MVDAQKSGPAKVRIAGGTVDKGDKTSRPPAKHPTEHLPPPGHRQNAPDKKK